jgi:hypothetical protein
MPPGLNRRAAAGAEANIAKATSAVTNAMILNVVRRMIVLPPTGQTKQ